MYAVTGASGKLGRLVVEGLLDAGIDSPQLVALVRTPAKVADLAERGVTVRAADYDQPASLITALAGVDSLLLVSASEPGKRVPQHQAVIDAAVAAGVTRVVYTSVLRADTTQLSLAAEHKATEEALNASGLHVTVLRNGWYTENYTEQLATYLAAGAIVGATANGRVAAATRADYAAAAVAVLTGNGPNDSTPSGSSPSGSGAGGAIYELGGTAFTMADLADAITRTTGTSVIVKDVSVAQYENILAGFGLDPGTAAFVAGLDEATARGDLDTDSTDLATLIGRPPTPMFDVVAAAAAR